jgi:hypothetical protein
MAHKDDDFTSDGKKIEWVPQRKHQPNYLGHYNKGIMPEPTLEDIKCELQLDAIGDFVPLSINFDLKLFKEEMKQYKDSWVPYLRREGITNNREGLLLVGAEGDSVGDSLSMPEVRKRLGEKDGERINEIDLHYPTEAFHNVTALHPITKAFDMLGRTMLVKLNKGGWFPPHRDAPFLSRDCFRLVGFLSGTTGHGSFEWEHNYRRVDIEPGRCYYVDTRKTHRTACWGDESIHLVMNVPKTYENCLKVLSMTEHH